MFRTVDQLQLVICRFARLETRAPVSYTRLRKTSPDAAQSTWTLLVNHGIGAGTDVLQHDAVVDNTSPSRQRGRVRDHLRGEGLYIGG